MKNPGYMISKKSLELLYPNKGIIDVKYHSITLLLYRQFVTCIGFNDRIRCRPWNYVSLLPVLRFKNLKFSITAPHSPYRKSKS